jgi:hypothetical protein
MNTRFLVKSANDEILMSPLPAITISDKEQDFIMDIDNTLTVLRTLYKEKNSTYYFKYFDQLLKIAQVGLVGENPHIDLSRKAILQLKTEIVNRESTSIKNMYLIDLGKVAIYYVIFFIVIYSAIEILVSKNIINFSYKIFSNFSILLCGSTVGVWISSTISKTQLEFDDLITINSNQLIPNLKIVFTSLLTIFFGLLFYKKVLVFKMSGISTESFADDNIVTLIFGLVLGLNERLLGNSLIKKTKDVIKI